ncbi:hypothetical protein DIPPA_05435 [Diplonema papillatum]|nr:hypothetical protein DIPPA_05435 [Diplonema papillatum]
MSRSRGSFAFEAASLAGIIVALHKMRPASATWRSSTAFDCSTPCTALSSSSSLQSGTGI